jgi:hypothetical protein
MNRRKTLMAAVSAALILQPAWSWAQTATEPNKYDWDHMSPMMCVTLHQIVRMRRFTRVAAANLRIISHEIIKYAAITIAPQIAAKRSVA